MSKIIIVEDDQMISEIYCKKFSSSGFEVFAATTAEQALAIAGKEKADVVMTDLIMPKMDGFQLIEKLRGGEYDANIKIIVTSNLSQKEDRDKAIKLGADGFVTKSEFSPSELVAEIQRLLNQYQKQKKNELIQSGDADYIDTNKWNKQKKILLIEDEDIFIDMFGGKLKQDGFFVESANNGAWGLKEAMKNDYDLFVIDMMMPAMTGDEIVEKLKMEDKTKNIPIIVLSASLDDEVAKKVMAMGATEFYIKTKITPSELSDKIIEILSKTE
jgi:DNA-binding response OmpR family regulator